MITSALRLSSVFAHSQQIGVKLSLVGMSLLLVGAAPAAARSSDSGVIPLAVGNTWTYVGESYNGYLKLHVKLASTIKVVHATKLAGGYRIFDIRTTQKVYANGKLQPPQAGGGPSDSFLFLLPDGRTATVPEQAIAYMGLGGVELNPQKVLVVWPSFESLVPGLVKKKRLAVSIKPSVLKQLVPGLGSTPHGTFVDEVTFKVLGRKTIDVPAGRFNAVHIRITVQIVSAPPGFKPDLIKEINSAAVALRATDEWVAKGIGIVCMPYASYPVQSDCSSRWRKDPPTGKYQDSGLVSYTLH